MLENEYLKKQISVLQVKEKSNALYIEALTIRNSELEEMLSMQLEIILQLREENKNGNLQNM